MNAKLGNGRLLLIVLLILLLGLASKFLRASPESEDVHKNLQLQNNVLNFKVDSLTSLITEYRRLLEKEAHMDTIQLRQIKGNSSLNSTNNVVRYLTKHNELIPFKGVLGGTMGFYSPENIILIDNHTFALFEDGHIGGYMLLEYQAVKDSMISWKVLDAYLEK